MPVRRFLCPAPKTPRFCLAPNFRWSQKSAAEDAPAPSSGQVASKMDEEEEAAPPPPLSGEANVPPQLPRLPRCNIEKADAPQRRLSEEADAKRRRRRTERR